MAPEVQTQMLSLYDQLIQEGIEKGREEGREEGLKKGIVEGKADVVLNLFESGMDIPFIVKVTKLTSKQVLKIIDQSSKK